MESGSDEKLVIFLERMYFSHLMNAEIIQVRKLLYDLAEAKATALGAKILVAQDYEDIAEEKLLKKTSTNVYISKSKNGWQYLDSLGGAAYTSAKEEYVEHPFLVIQTAMHHAGAHNRNEVDYE